MSAPLNWMRQSPAASIRVASVLRERRLRAADATRRSSCRQGAEDDRDGNSFVSFVSSYPSRGREPIRAIHFFRFFLFFRTGCLRPTSPPTGGKERNERIPHPAARPPPGLQYFARRTRRRRRVSDRL